MKDSNLRPIGYEPIALTYWANGPKCGLHVCNLNQTLLVPQNWESQRSFRQDLIPAIIIWLNQSTIFSEMAYYCELAICQRVSFNFSLFRICRWDIPAEARDVRLTYMSNESFWQESNLRHMDIHCSTTELQKLLCTKKLRRSPPITVTYKCRLIFTCQKQYLADDICKTPDGLWRLHVQLLCKVNTGVKEKIYEQNFYDDYTVGIRTQ